MDYREIGRIFYRDGYRLAASHLENNLNAVAAGRAVKALYEAVDGLLEAFLKRSGQEGKPAECRKGCFWCCRQAVFTVTHELLFLRDHIMENLPGKLDMFLDTARKKSLETEGKTLKDQLRIRMACPFLEDGDCSVYSARPMACRIYLSSSVSACRKEHDNPGDEKEFPGLFEFPLQAGRMLNEGFVAYLKHNGLSSAEVPIEQGFASVMTHGQSFRTWLK